MGKVLKFLSKTALSSFRIFPKRTVIECDENYHFHFRNIRLNLNEDDFVAVANTFMVAYKKYLESGIIPAPGQHCEIGRGVLTTPRNPELAIELSDNLYKRLHYDNAEFYEDDDFIHIHYGDSRIEMSKEEFLKMADSFTEAAKELRA